MSKDRVVITGMGWVTPLGSDIDAVWRRLLAGESAVGPVTHFDASTFKTNFAAEVKNFRLEDYAGDGPGLVPLRGGLAAHAGAGTSTRFALAAAARAIAMAGLHEFGGLKRRRFGLYLGSSGMTHGAGTCTQLPLAATSLRGCSSRPRWR